MVVPAIIIELAPADAPPALAAALVDACNHGPEAGIDCALASEDTSTVSPRIAVVTWRSPTHLAVDVQVGVQSPQGGVWSTRHLDFAESDAEVERWRAVGLVIATLAKQSEAPASAAQPEPPRSAPQPTVVRPQATQPTPATANRMPAWTAELAGHVSRGESLFDVRGGSLRFSRLVASPGFYVGVAGRYEALSKGDVSLRWAWLSAGLGLDVPLADPRVTLDTRLEPTFGLTSATLAGDSASPSGKLWGLREAVGVTWWPAAWAGLALSLEAAQLNRATIARVVATDGNAQQQLHVGAVTWGAGLGLRFAFGAR